MLSTSARRILSRFNAAPEQADAPVSLAPQHMGPTLVMLESPIEDVEDVIASLGSPLSDRKRAPNRWLQRQRNKGLGVSEKDPTTVQIEGRKCCMTLINTLDRRLPYLAIPSRHTCPTCGTVWGVEMRVREERRHGW